MRTGPQIFFSGTSTNIFINTKGSPTTKEAQTEHYFSTKEMIESKEANNNTLNIIKKHSNNVFPLSMLFDDM